MDCTLALCVEYTDNALLIATNKGDVLKIEPHIFTEINTEKCGNFAVVVEPILGKKYKTRFEQDSGCPPVLSHRCAVYSQYHDGPVEERYVDEEDAVTSWVSTVTEEINAGVYPYMHRIDH